jgi:hypothetical protein
MEVTVDSKDYLEVRAKLIQDFPFFAETALKIVPKGLDGEELKTGILTQPFVLNDTQRYIHDRIEKQKRERGYVRMIILKARQVGASTYIQGRDYWLTSNNFGKRCVIMTEADQSRDNLFNMVKTYHENMPIAIKPQTRASNMKALIFDNNEGTGLKSRYDVKTAESKGGLGITSHVLHLSELAYYADNAISNISGLLESIPSEKPGIYGTEVIIESTANGTGGLFYSLWKKSEEQERRGQQPEFERIFISWLLHKGYSSDYPADFSTLDEYEKNLVNQGATLYQINWRRNKIASIIPPIGYTSEIFFQQWYPSTPEEAFIYSGRNVFPVTYIKKAELEVARPVSEGNFTLSDGKYYQSKDKPTVKIWAYPEGNTRYCMGVDVAEGLVTGDFTSIDVLKYPSGAQVMHVNLKIDPDQLAVLLCHIGQMYNLALVGVESNNHGLTTLTVLKHRYYPNIYQRIMIDANTPDKRVKKAGWLTTQKSKHKIIDQLLGLLRDGESGILCKETLTEMGTFVINEDGTLGAKPGCYDDRVMSYAIAVEVLFSMGGTFDKTVMSHGTGIDNSHVMVDEDEW